MKKLFLLILIAVSINSFGQNAFKGATNTYKNKIDYETNLGSTFSPRSIVDKHYIDSARNKARDSVVALIGVGRDKSWTIESPTASENIGLWRTDVDIVLNKSAFVIRGGSPSVTMNIVYASDRSSGSPTKVWGTDQTFTSTTTGDLRTNLNIFIPAGSWIWLTTSAVGTVTDFTISLYYDLD